MLATVKRIWIDTKKTSFVGKSISLVDSVVRNQSCTTLLILDVWRFHQTDESITFLLVIKIGILGAIVNGTFGGCKYIPMHYARYVCCKSIIITTVPIMIPAIPAFPSTHPTQHLKCMCNQDGGISMVLDF